MQQPAAWCRLHGEQWCLVVPHHRVCTVSPKPSNAGSWVLKTGASARSPICLASLYAACPHTPLCHHIPVVLHRCHESTRSRTGLGRAKQWGPVWGEVLRAVRCVQGRKAVLESSSSCLASGCEGWFPLGTLTQTGPVHCTHRCSRAEVRAQTEDLLTRQHPAAGLQLSFVPRHTPPASHCHFPTHWL